MVSFSDSLVLGLLTFMCHLQLAIGLPMRDQAQVELRFRADPLLCARDSRVTQVASLQLGDVSQE